MRSRLCAVVFFACLGAPAAAQQPQLVSEGLAGYISMEVPAPPDEFGYGVSLYATAWPLVEHPLRDFQIGLASIWIVPENRKIEEPLLPTGTLARDTGPSAGRATATSSRRSRAAWASGPARASARRRPSSA